jgi:hypothetical protein
MASEPSTPDATKTYTGLDTTNLRFGYYVDALDPTETFGFDELRIGDTFASVTPEPSTMAGMGIALGPF